MSNISFHVPGIVNAQMKTSLKNALDKLPGVQEVAINQKLDIVTVEFNEPTNENAIQACIEESGFKVI